MNTPASSPPAPDSATSPATKKARSASTPSTARSTAASPAASPAAALHRGIEKFLGRAYDIAYAPDDAKIYCSELVYKVYDRELGIKLGHWQKLGELDWKPYGAFVRKMERGNLPLDREMITPVELTRSPAVREVH